jgi:hypothetical protein
MVVYGGYIFPWYSSTRFMVMLLRDNHICIRSTYIIVVSSAWITKMFLLIINAKLNISNKALEIILDDKFRITNLES